MPLPLLPLLVTAGAALAKEFVPDVVGMVAGKGGERIAEQVIDTVAEVTGVAIPKDDADGLEAGTAEAIALARADPQMAARVRVRLAELEVEQERMFLADRQDARARDVALAEAGDMNVRADLMIFLAFIAVVVCVVAVAVYGDVINAAAIGIISTAAGALLKMLGDAFAFEFGSSRGSKKKDGAMAALLTKLNGNGGIGS